MKNPITLSLKVLLLVSVLFNFSCSVMISDLKTAGQETTQYWLENVEQAKDSTGNPQWATDEGGNEITDESGNKIPVYEFKQSDSAPSEGFVLSRTDSETIGKNLVKKEYYTRVKVTLSFDPDGGLWVSTDPSSTNAKTLSLRYGETVPNPPFAAPEKTGLNLTGWANAEGKKLGSDILYAPARDMTFTAVWSGTEAAYRIKFLFESVDGSTYAERAEAPARTASGDKNGVTVDNTWTYNGFTAQENSKSTGTLNPDGTTEVVFRYSRNTVTLTFCLENTTGGSWSDGTTADKTLSKKFEASLSQSDIPAPKAGPNYEFKEWDKPVPETVPAAAETYTAKWNQVKADYTVKYLFESLDGSTYAEDASYPQETKSAPLAGETVTYPAVPGFNAEAASKSTGALDPAGTAVVELKYTRKMIKLTFTANSGKWSDGSTTFEASRKFGTPTAGLIPADPEYDDLNVFDRWDPAVPAAFPATDTVYDAKWTPLDAADVKGRGIYTNGDIEVTYLFTSGNLKVTVKHELSDLDFKFVEIANTVLKNGTTDSLGSITKGADGSKTAYSFTVPFAKAAGKYALQLVIENDRGAAYSEQLEMTKTN